MEPSVCQAETPDLYTLALPLCDYSKVLSGLWVSLLLERAAGLHSWLPSWLTLWPPHLHNDLSDTIPTSPEDLRGL